MDSFTQIALGAAVGETVLGKKVGNRAMVWGAVGGTIPDLDILANFFTDEMTALAFHRGWQSHASGRGYSGGGGYGHMRHSDFDGWRSVLSDDYWIYAFGNCLSALVESVLLSSGVNGSKCDLERLVVVIVLGGVYASIVGLLYGLWNPSFSAFF